MLRTVQQVLFPATLQIESTTWQVLMNIRQCGHMWTDVEQNYLELGGGAIQLLQHLTGSLTQRPHRDLRNVDRSSHPAYKRRDRLPSVRSRSADFD